MGSHAGSLAHELSPFTNMQVLTSLNKHQLSCQRSEHRSTVHSLCTAPAGINQECPLLRSLTTAQMATAFAAQSKMAMGQARQAAPKVKDVGPPRGSATASHRQLGSKRWTCPCAILTGCRQGPTARGRSGKLLICWSPGGQPCRAPCCPLCLRPVPQDCSCH
jgi:hypothetical protein